MLAFIVTIKTTLTSLGGEENKEAKKMASAQLKP